MKYGCASVVALLTMVLALGLGARDAQASFHCMRIHAVMAGANGDAGIQYVELRMPTGGQAFVSGTQLLFFDATGTQTGSFTLPGNVTNGASGSSILVGTSDFALNATVTPDFAMPGNVIAPAGKVQFVGAFNCNSTGTIIDSVAYGGAGYVGTTDFGTPNGASAPTAGTQALTLNNLNLLPTNNSTEYSLLPATPRNNAGTVGTVGPPTDGDDDGFDDDVELFIGTDPLVACGISAWPPDFDDNGAVNINDVFAVLESFGKSSADGDWISGNHIRKDLDANNAININDVFIELDFFAQSCA